MRFLAFILSLLIPVSAFATYPNVIQVYPQNIIQRHSVQFDADTFLGLPGYYGVMDKQKIELGKQSQIDKENLNLALKIILQNGGGNPVQSPIVAPQKEIAAEVDSLDKQVYNIFKKNCASCHNETTASGGLKLITKDGGLYNLSGSDRSMVYFRTNNAIRELSLALMPQNGTALQDNEVNTLKVWAVKKLREEKGK
jgi:mono/diheme cytochrome c family protein